MKPNYFQRFLNWLTGPVPTSVVIAFVIGAIFIMIAGADPISGYQSMFRGSFGSGLGLANTVQRAIPLVGMALAIAVAFRAGVINLGAEGQMILGGLVGVLVVLYVPGPPVLIMLLACVAGAAVGALWGLLPALLQSWPGVPLLITSLLLNYPARYFSSWMVRFPLKDPESSMVATDSFSPDVQIPLFAPPSSPLGQSLLNNLGKDSVLTIMGRTVNWSFVVVALLVVAVLFMNSRTKLGFEAGIHGFNSQFARYSGVHSGRMTAQTMIISGGIAGLIGVMFTIGAPNTRLIDGQILETNYAWTGLLVALLALYRPLGVLIAGIFFAGIIAGSGAMGRDLSMSPQIASVIQGIVIILIAFRVQIPVRKRKSSSELVEARMEHDQAEEEVGRV